MARRADTDAEIDRLYQLPPGEFVAARNALARTAGAGGASIRGLQKPTLPAWAVNQLYWQQRATYQDLLDRAADLRATHAAASRGRSTDLRGASRAYEVAVEQALKGTLAVLSDHGHPVTDATRQAIATTLRSLPGEEPPGRLTRQLEPRGFEMLAAASGAGRVRTNTAAARSRSAAPPERVSGTTAERSAARHAAERAAQEAAARATQEAEQALRRDEFQAARAARDAERALQRVQQARDALQDAQAALDEAERAVTAATRARDAAQARVARSQDQLTAARAREDAARRT